VTNPLEMPDLLKIAITRIFDTLDDKIEQVSSALAALRDNLIPVLLSG